MFGINKLRSDEMPYFGAKDPCLGAFVQLLCNQKPATVSNVPTFCHNVEARTPILERPQKQPTFCKNYMPLTSLDRLRTLASQLTVIRACDLRKYGIHRQTLKRALDRRVLVRISRGLYVSAVRRERFRGHSIGTPVLKSLWPFRIAYLSSFSKATA